MPNAISEIKIFILGHSKTNSEEIAHWLEHLKVPSDLQIPYHELTDEEVLISLAGKRCYNSFVPKLNANVTKTRSSWTDYIDNILASGHGSVLEHASVTVGIEGCTRVFTAEMNRHRAGVAISEQSLRYCRYDQIEYWLPEMIREKVGDDPELAEKKRITREIFEQAFEQDENNYKELSKIWELDKSQDFHYKKVVTSMMRRIVGMGMCTGGVWTFNLRALRHILTLRATPEAEEEICYVVSQIGKILIEHFKVVLADFELVDDLYWIPKYRKV